MVDDADPADIIEVQWALWRADGGSLTCSTVG